MSPVHCLPQGMSLATYHLILHALVTRAISQGMLKPSLRTYTREQLVSRSDFFSHSTIKKIENQLLRSNISGKALSILESNFTKKPKNPV